MKSPFTFSHFLFLGFCLFLFSFSALSPSLARDPRKEEIPEVQEIAYFLKFNTFQIYSAVANHGGVFSDFRATVQALDRLDRKAGQFYDRTLKSSDAPWRATSAYRELNQAFLDARSAFIQQPIYFLDPRAFEETAFLMGALLQFYQEPAYIAYPASPGYFYPQNVYGWLPPFYNFSTVRFANARLYPWGARVIFAPGRR